MRKCSTGVFPPGAIEFDHAEDLVEDPREDVAEDQPEEDGDPRQESTEDDGSHDEEHHRDEADPLVLGPVHGGDHRGEVETDEHDDGTADGGRQHLLHHAAAGEVHDDADDDQHRPRDEDGAGDLLGVAALGADRRDRGHEGCRGT